MSKTSRIDFALSRTVVLRQGTQMVSYAVRPITQEEWFAYFDGLISTAERKGREVIQHTDASAAGVELVEKLAEYAGACENGAFFSESEPVPSIPLAHKLALANVLTSAFVPDEAMHRFGEIPLTAIWSAGENGTMRRHKDLLHVFNEPTAEQNRRYRRDESRAQIIGGSRKGVTVYKGAQRTLAALYDELIVRVEGYVFNGVPLEGQDSIAKHMDAYHKVASVARLFVPQEIEIEDEEEEGN